MAFHRREQWWLWGSLKSGSRESLNWRHLFVAAVAHYLGDPQDGEAMLSAYARALGYSGSWEVVQAIEDKRAGRKSKFDARYRIANQKLLTKLGSGPQDVSDETIDRIWAGLPERYKRDIHQTDHRLRNSVTWRQYPPSRSELHRLREV